MVSNHEHQTTLYDSGDDLVRSASGGNVSPLSDGVSQRDGGDAATGAGAGSTAAAAGAEGSGDVEGVQEKAAPENLTRGQKIKKHFRKWWWAYLIGNIIFLAILLPVFLLVAIPAIIQLVVDKAHLPIDGGLIKAVAPDRVALGLDTSFPGLSGLTVKLDAEDVSLYNKDAGKDDPYVIFRLGEQSIRGKTAINIPETQAGIENEDELVKWLSAFFNKKETEISLNEQTTAHLGALKGHVNLDKTSKLDGLDKLGTIKVRDAQLMEPPLEDGSNIIGNITMHNRSKITVDIGNQTLNAMAGDLVVGSIHVPNLILPPGDSDYKFTGKLYLGALASNLNGVIKSQVKALPRGVLAIGLRGNSTVVDGERIPYVEGVLNDASIKSELAISSLFKGLITGIKTGETDVGGLVEQLVHELPGDNKPLIKILDKWGLTGDD